MEGGGRIESPSSEDRRLGSGTERCVVESDPRAERRRLTVLFWRKERKEEREPFEKPLDDVEG